MMTRYITALMTAKIMQKRWAEFHVPKVRVSFRCVQMMNHAFASTEMIHATTEMMIGDTILKKITKKNQITQLEATPQ